MSEFDETDFDETEIAEAYESDSEDLQPEDIFKMVMIDKIRKKRVMVELQDNQGDIVELKDVIQELLSYIEDRLKDHNGNQFTEQILPLMAQSVVGGLGRMMGIRFTAFMLANDNTKTALINMMCVAFLLLKFVQTKELSINTYEEEVSDNEIESITRKSKANQTATLASLAGDDPIEVLKALRHQGHITDNDLKDLLGTKSEESLSDESDNKDNKSRN